MTISKWLFAQWYETLNSVVEPKVIPHRRSTAGNCTGATMDLGAGSGLNLPYFQNCDSITLVEPDKYMRSKLHKRISASDNVKIVADKGECLTLPDNSFDSVVSTLVLCMVDDIERVISEVYRVLKPGGKFFFYEHVVAKSRVGKTFQGAVNPLWRCLTTGCHLQRYILNVISSQGFQKVKSSEFSMRIGPFPPIPNVVGYSTK